MKELFFSPAWLGATLGGVLLAAAAAWLAARRVRRRREGLVAPALAEKAGLLSRDRWTPFAALLAIVATLAVTLAILLAAPAITRRLGETGMKITNKVMALITAVIGIQFVINGTTAVAVQILRAAR